MHSLMYKILNPYYGQATAIGTEVPAITRLGNGGKNKADTENISQ